MHMELSDVSCLQLLITRKLLLVLMTAVSRWDKEEERCESAS